MPKGHDFVFVLWRDKFEEATAIIFVTELRKAGFLVKLVGLSPPKIVGVNGVTVTPDLMLDEALPLAASTICLVIPCPISDIKCLKNDPRLSEFISQAHSNKRAQFVVGPLNGTDIASLSLFPAPGTVLVYPDDECLVKFVRELAFSLPTPI